MDKPTLLLLGLAIIVVCIFIYFVYSGLLESINFQVTKPPFISSKIYMYKCHQGRYKDCGPHYLAAADFVKDHKDQILAGIYYDDPNKVPPGKTRYTCGVLFSSDNAEHQKVVEKMKHAGYSLFRLPVVEKAITTSFPFRNHLSILIAVYRVYPAMKSYVKEHKLSPTTCMEVYVGNRMHFVFPLEKGNEFLVPEVRDLRK